jgi:phosphatidate phosphatase LPIN
MQYVRNLSDSVSSAWNSINPATLSGAIDVIVVEQEDGSLVCSPFHVRFGKFSLLRPYEKKVEFHVNGVKQPYAMKLGEEGEAFFVFETSDNIPKDMQTSPLVSPASSPPLDPETGSLPGLQEPDLLDLDEAARRPRRPPPAVVYSTSASASRDTGAPYPIVLLSLPAADADLPLSRSRQSPLDLPRALAWPAKVWRLVGLAPP